MTKFPFLYDPPRTPRRHTGPHRRSALTLIELMVAMTVSAVIVLATLEAFQQGRFVQMRVDRQMQASAREYDLWRLLSGDVANSVVLLADDDAGVWIGQPDSMRFLAVGPGGRPMQIEYKLAAYGPGTPAGGLLRSTRLASGSVPVGQWGHLTVADGVRAFDLQYGQVAEGSDALTWTTEFNGAQAPPKAVKVRLTWNATEDESADGPQVVEWVLATRADTSANAQGGT